MDDNNILVSNGTCYYAIDKESSDNVIPCGNVANGAYACCQEGDYCLEYNMCYNDNHTTTYMAGCTDPTFGASECPSKDHSDQQLLGLTQCDGTDTSDGNVLWSGCPGPATRTVLGQPSVCSCSGTADGLLYAPTSIAAVASLPTKIGETISFKKGHTPSWATAGSSMTTSVGGHSTIVASTPAPTSKPVSSSGGFEAEPLSTGAKAGIGIGAAALGLAALGLILWVATWCRRRHAEKSEGEKKSPDHPTSPDQHGLAILHQPTPGYYYSSEAGSITGSVPPSYNSPEWPASAGFKSELPTDCERRFRFELPAGNAAGKSEAEAEAAAQRASTPLLPMHEASAHYPKQGTLANAFVVPSNLSVTQPSQSQYHVSTSGGDTVATTAQTAPISELHG